MNIDVTDAGLKIIFTNTYGKASNGSNVHYHYELNLFYKTLAAKGLTKELLSANKSKMLLNYGLGLINIYREFPDNAEKRNITVFEYIKKINTYQPKIICFNGKEAARMVFGKLTTANIEIGMQEEMIGKTKLFIAPSTAYTAHKYWDERVWQLLAKIASSI